MIALSCPHNFGVNISHLGFMNPDWAAMHDAGGSPQRPMPPRRVDTKAIRPEGRKHGSKSSSVPAVNCTSRLRTRSNLKIRQLSEPVVAAKSSSRPS